MAEYAELIGKIDDCFGRIEILKREAEAVKSRKLREVNGREIVKYDRIIDVLKAACSEVRNELSTYDRRIMELDTYR